MIHCPNNKNKINKKYLQFWCRDLNDSGESKKGEERRICLGENEVTGEMIGDHPNQNLWIWLFKFSPLLTSNDVWFSNLCNQTHKIQSRNQKNKRRRKKKERNKEKHK